MAINIMAEYEFTTKENQSVARLHQKLLWISVGLFLLGAMLSIGAFFRPRPELMWAQLLAGVPFIMLGFVFWRPLDNLKRITTRTGTDITELMTAVSDMRLAFGTAAIVFGILSLLTLFGIIRILTM